MSSDSKRWFIPALLAAAVLGAAAPAAAQSIAQPRSWTVTPFLGTSAGVGDPAFDNSLGVGVAVGYDMTYNLGFEGEISHLFDVAGSTDNIDWSISNFSANAIYHFDVKRVTPYATFGIGVERSSYDLKGDDSQALEQDPSSSEVSFNVGGGVKYAINDKWVARGDVRRFQANDIAPDYWRLYGGLSWVFRK